MHLLYLSSVWPEPTSSAAGTRVMQIIAACQTAGWQLTFAATARPSVYSADLAARGIACEQIKINDSSFDRFAAEVDPDIVLFDRFMLEEQFAMRLAEVCPDAMRVLDTSDLHFLRRARQQAVLNQQPLDLHTQDMLRELASMYRCDLTLIISSYEMELLQESGLPDELLHACPFMFDSSEQHAVPDFAQRADLVMIGNFLHKPNSDAVSWVRQSVWPLIRQRLPDVACHVYGACAEAAHLQLQDETQGFYVHGRCDDACATLSRYRINLAPLRFGAGLKGKIADGWQVGTPCVSTAVGAEGMCADDADWGGRIAHSPEAIADAVQELYQVEDAWQQASQQGRVLLQQLFSADEHGPVLIERMTAVHEHLAQQRRQNIIGAMLQLQQMKSTLYLSRWIEEKTRRQDD